MTDQPSEGRDNFEPANEINEESFMPAEGYGEEPEKKRSLASHHRSHRHHSSSGSTGSTEGYGDSASGFGRSSGTDYSGSSDLGFGRSSGSYSGLDAGYGRSQGGYSDGYSAGYEAGYRSSRQHSSQGDYSDGYSAGYEAGLRSSHSHSSRYSDGYDDGYESGYRSSHHSSSHHSSRSSSSSSGSKPGRLASHHRPRHHHHHHHHTESQQTDQNYVSSMETIPIDMLRDGQSAEFEMSRPLIGADPLEDSARNISADVPMTEYSVSRPEDTYYADYTANPIDTYYSESKPDSFDSNQNRGPGQLASSIAAAKSLNPPPTRDASTIESSNSRRRKRKIKKRKTVLGILVRILIALIVLFIAGIGGLVYLRARGQKTMTHDAEEVKLSMEKENTPDDVEVIEDDGKTVTYKGEKYRWNDNISTILFLGSDRTVEQQQERESVIGINGQADTILLGIIDNTNKKISFININRDTMTNVSQYTPDGDYAGDKQMQICLAYSYGKDNEESCEMMASTVSNLLYGIPIDSYARISYDAVPMLNDSVGGVTVKVIEDMTEFNPAFVKGETVTLVGKQALQYIRERDLYVLESNELRVARQKQYFYAFMHRTIDATRADLTLPIGLYNNAKPYMTTSITPSQVTYLTSKILEYGVSDDAIHSVTGNAIDGANGLVEYHADDVKLYELILNTFYNKVK